MTAMMGHARVIIQAGGCKTYSCQDILARAACHAATQARRVQQMLNLLAMGALQSRNATPPQGIDPLAGINASDVRNIAPEYLGPEEVARHQPHVLVADPSQSHLISSKSFRVDALRLNLTPEELHPMQESPSTTRLRICHATTGRILITSCRRPSKKELNDKGELEPLHSLKSRRERALLGRCLNRMDLHLERNSREKCAGAYRIHVVLRTLLHAGSTSHKRTSKVGSSVLQRKEFATYRLIATPTILACPWT